eukprot:TCALIF_06553-PA protein Name:"Protein of unknown function" AED:0.22 eAED:0.47 QI:0/0/0/1/0/0/2/0/141
MDATNSRITFLQNTLDKDYLKVYIKQTLGNIGGSYVMNEAGGDSSLEQIQSVLLSDVIKHIQFNKRQTENLTIIMKVDIERIPISSKQYPFRFLHTLCGHGVDLCPGEATTIQISSSVPKKICGSYDKPIHSQWVHPIFKK